MAHSATNGDTTSKQEDPIGIRIPMKSIHNLRRIDANGKLFRSAKQDKATPDDIERCLQSLGIRTFLDFRNSVEYKNGGKGKVIDSSVRVLIPVLPDPNTKPYPTGVAVQLKDLKGKEVSPRELPRKTPRRYLINFFARQFVVNIFNKAPLYMKLLGLLCLLIDFILGNNHIYTVRCFSSQIKKIDLTAHYVNIMEFGGKQLCFVLKTISDRDNLPAIISCAHGKDRTGIVAALVLCILGKSDEYIAQEYALSEEGLRLVQESVHFETVHKYKVDESYALAKKETMLGTLRTIRKRYGSVEAFLESIGFDQDDQEKLRQTLS